MNTNLSHPREQGFTLLEILVALVLLTLTFGVLMRIFSGGVRQADVAESHVHALAIAQNQLTAAGVEIPLAEGERMGEAAPGYRWRVISRREDGDATLETAAHPLILYRVEVEVNWQDGAIPRQLRLVTLKNARRPLP